MNMKKNSQEDLAAFLNTPDAATRWKSSPVDCLEAAGVSVSHLGPVTRKGLDARLIKADPKMIGASAGCVGCTAAVTLTLGGMTAALVVAIAALLVGTDGGDAPVVPAELVAAEDLTAAAIAAETGVPVTVVLESISSVISYYFTWILANRWRAALMFATGTLLTAIYVAISHKICQKAGKCS